MTYRKIKHKNEMKEESISNVLKAKVTSCGIPVIALRKKKVRKLCNDCMTGDTRALAD